MTEPMFAPEFKVEGRFIKGQITFWSTNLDGDYFMFKPSDKALPNMEVHELIQMIDELRTVRNKLTDLNNKAYRGEGL